METDLFDIEDLLCAYPSNGKAVLHIGKLSIPRGRLTVILGRSGSGKSTLVEALGLMNNTMVSGSAVYHSPAGPMELQSIWPHRKRVADIRRRYYSFIFQEDYLMPHFTCYENLLVTGLIQGRMDREDAGRLIHEPLDYMRLSGNGMLEKSPGSLAGGQKQRLSFIRAVIREFDVLFGDEPTGNLDDLNSVSLFEFIRQVIREKSCSVVLVSHNVELSVEEADRIIVLTPGSRQGPAAFCLDPQHIFSRNGHGWEHFGSDRELTSHIRSIL